MKKIFIGLIIVVLGVVGYALLTGGIKKAEREIYQFDRIMYDAFVEEIGPIENIYFSSKIDKKYTSKEKKASLNIDDTVVAYYENNNLYIKANGNILAPSDCSSMFSIETLESIDFKDVFKTYETTNMSGMFEYLESLKKIDVSGFNTSKVTDMSKMFKMVNKVTELDVSSFDTSNVTNMSWMFSSLSELKKLDVSYFNTSSMTDMSFMFAGLEKITTLDVSNFNTSNVIYMNGMFNSLHNVVTLDLSNFNTSKVTFMAGMFAVTKSLKELDVSSFDTSKVTSMAMMFGESGLEKIDLSNWDFSSLKRTGDHIGIANLFNNMPNLKEVIVPSKEVKDIIIENSDKLDKNVIVIK